MTQAMFAQDSRSIYQRIRRYALSRIAHAEGLTVREGATKDDLIRLLEAHKIDPGKHMKFMPYEVRDRAGNLLGREIYPVEDEHASARNGVDASSVVGEKITKKAEEEAAFEAARIDALERDNEQLKRENAQLKETLETRLAALEGAVSSPPPKSDPDSPQGKYWADFRKGREMGLPIKSGMKHKTIVAMIERAEADKEDE